MSDFVNIGAAAARVVDGLRWTGSPGPGTEVLTFRTRDEWLAKRHETIGSSEISAMLGISPFKGDTPLALYHRKANGLDVKAEMTRQLRRGLLMEDDALSILQDDHPDWIVTPNPPVGGKFFRNMEARLSCTPDAFIEAPGRPRGICQVKTVNKFSFRQKWTDDTGTIEPPLNVAVQAVQDAYLTGAEWAMVLAMVMDDELDTHESEVPIHAGLIEKIKGEAALFWGRVTIGEPPPADYSNDAYILAAIHKPNNDLPPLDLTTDNRIMELVAEREALSRVTKEAEGERERVNAEIVEKLAGHTVALLGDGRKITRKLQTRREHIVAASTFPVLRITKGAA